MKLKKNQMELLGLAFFVVLIIFGLIMYYSMKGNEEDNTLTNYLYPKYSNYFINTFLHTTVEYYEDIDDTKKLKRQMVNVIKDCFDKTYPSELYINNTFLVNLNHTYNLSKLKLDSGDKTLLDTCNITGYILESQIKEFFINKNPMSFYIKVSKGSEDYTYDKLNNSVSDFLISNNHNLRYVRKFSKYGECNSNTKQGKVNLQVIPMQSGDNLNIVFNICDD